MSKNMFRAIVVSASMLSMTSVFAEDAAEMAKKLANPIAAMISVPLQSNYDSDYGQDDSGSKFLINVQPVIPFSISEDWNLITRTIIPVIWQDDIPSGSGSESGIGSTLLSTWFSPKAPSEGGWIWGVGPVFLLPTATDDKLGGDQWGTGPTAVALKQDGPVTVGGLINHVWSFAEDDNAKVNNTFIQPFFSYITPEAVTYSLNTESTYNWETEEWSVPINAMVQKVTKIGNQLVAFQGGVRYWAVTDSDNSAEGWGLRFAVTFLFPK